VSSETGYQYVTQAGLELKILLLLPPRVLGLQKHTTMPSILLIFVFVVVFIFFFNL
jgi:hypothetical protein